MASFSPEKLVGQAEAQGWRIEPKKNGWMLYPPDSSGRPVMIHRTPSDENWHKMAIRLMRASGFKAN